MQRNNNKNIQQQQQQTIFATTTLKVLSIAATKTTAKLNSNIVNIHDIYISVLLLLFSSFSL